MRQKQLKMNQLIDKNKSLILSNKEEMERIERKIEAKHEKKLKQTNS